MLLLAVAVVTVGMGRQPQLDTRGDLTAVVYGHENAIWLAASPQYKPVKVSEGGKLMLGRRRGPRVALTDSGVVVTAIVDETLLAWRSTDQGASWSQPVTINSVPRAAREGLHGLSGEGNRLFVTWLDLRENRMQLYGALSQDGGATWSRNILIYDSPDGHICECCHPSAHVAANGDLYVMWRNWLGGARDMWLSVSRDSGKTWKPEKLGEGSWPLKGCPMDGGGFSVDSRGRVLSVWRRDKTVYTAVPGAPEQEIGPGRDVQISGDTIVYSTAEGLMLRRGGKTRALSPTGTFGSLDGSVVAWEDGGNVMLQRVE